MLHFIMLSLLFWDSGLATNVSDVSPYQNWKPDPKNGLTYCEVVVGLNQHSGIACGAASYAKMKKNDEYVTATGVTDTTLGLLNIATISKLAFTTERGFYQACKPYFIRLYDGFFKERYTNTCISAFPTPAGLDPKCDDSANVIMKPGSGYCMSEPVCGATVEVTFLTDGTGNCMNCFTYLWGAAVPVVISRFGQIAVAKCYGYELKPHPNPPVPIDTTILAN